MFHSSRGGISVTASEAIINGLASDGGLYVFDAFPQLDYKSFLQDDYQTMAAKILHLFFDEFSFEELHHELVEAYSSFDCPSVVEIKKVQKTYFLELFHGPTFAFKDLALVVLPRLMKLSKKKLGYTKNITILTATSGDTGGAALSGFHNVDGVSIVVLYPNHGISSIQEAQMCSFRGPNSEMLALDGNFDDCQSFVKKFFKEHSDLSLSSANSMNIGRLIPQIVYYFYSYVDLIRRKELKLDEPLNFVVPTGNFGNILAGFCAKQMGLPIQNLICASNQNAVLTDFFHQQVYDKRRPFYKTNSPSMDILVSSNLERFLYFATQDPTIVQEKMRQLQQDGVYQFTNPYPYFKAYCTNEQQTIETIRTLYEQTHYLIDPHTAVAYHAYLQYLQEEKSSVKTVIVSTASPFKFPEVLNQAISTDELQNVNKHLPSYPPIERKTISKEDVEQKVWEVIKCFM